MSKLRISSSLALICLIALSLISIVVPFGSAQTSGTTVQSTIITQDTTWTKAGSPYTLSGPVAVATGVTLTLEPGVTLNIATFRLTVNGTMNAKGTETDPIHISATETGYTSLILSAVGSSGAAGSGGVFEHTVFSTYSLEVGGGSLIFRNNKMTGLEMLGGNTLLENNIIDGTVFTYNDSPQILNNQIYGIISVQGGTPTIKGNTITTTNTFAAPKIGQDQYSKYYSIAIGQTSSNVCSATITNNTIAAGVYVQGTGGTEIKDNTINGGVTFAGGSATVNANSINGGINILRGGGYYDIENNVISSGATAGIYMQQGGGSYLGFGWKLTQNSALIQRNLITNSKYGLQLADAATVQSNTISNSQTAIYLQFANATFHYNNIVSYSQNSVYIESGESNIDASQNWWGTVDIQAVNQSIHDSRYDYNLGTVNIIPVLTAANPQAMPDPSIPLTSNSSTSPQPTTSTASVTPELTSNSQPSGTPNSATSKASQDQQVDQPNLQANLDWTEIALVVAFALIVALIGAVALLVRRNRLLKTRLEPSSNQ